MISETVLRVMLPKCYTIADRYGYLSGADVTTIANVVLKTKKGSVFVNVGAGTGTSTMTLYEASLIRDGQPETVYSVDFRDDDNPYGGLLNERNAFADMGLVRDIALQIKGDSTWVGQTWRPHRPMVDIVFQDAGHTRSELESEIAAWHPNIDAGGWFLFHDYGRDVWPEVASTVDRLMDELGYQKRPELMASGTHVGVFWKPADE